MKAVIEDKKTGSKEEIDLVDLIEQPAWKSILLDLVKSEKMDPWNIDIVKLADAYLKRINLLEETDLRIPANAILASAILLRTKASYLKLSSIEDEEEKEFEKLIEKFIPELKAPRRMREESRISLDELVNVIEVMVEKSKSKQLRLLQRQELKFQIPYTDKNIDEKIKEVLVKLKSLADSQGMVLFSQMVKTDDHTPTNIINTFVPLLFLMNDGQINMWQEECFGEIFISLKNSKN